MSVSQFKSFCPAYGGCEAKAIAVLDGEWEDKEKSAFIQGHYVHSWNQGTLEKFKANNPDLYSSRGKTAGQLKAEYKVCNAMIEMLESDPICMKALDGQKEVIFTADLFGIPWKIMIDSYNPQFKTFTDLKAIKAMDDKFWNNDSQSYENFMQHYGYVLQIAAYAEIERKANGREEGDWFVPHIVAVTKQDPPDHELIFFDYYFIQKGLAVIERHIDRVKTVKNREVTPNRCEKCEYCRATKKVRPRHYGEFLMYGDNDD